MILNETMFDHKLFWLLVSLTLLGCVPGCTCLGHTEQAETDVQVEDYEKYNLPSTEHIRSKVVHRANKREVIIHSLKNSVAC